ncbi:Phosphoinositide phosphatase [Nymphaea thermarum]|nr:Phosphoinositide phosphatase [Nymphaea thermarum]
MAKPENSTALPSYLPFASKSTQSSDSDVDPNSCSLEKFKLYETRAVRKRDEPPVASLVRELTWIRGCEPVVLFLDEFRFYLIGSDRLKMFFRVLKIDRSEPSELNVSEDPVVYSPLEIKNLLQRISEGNRATGGLTFVAKVYGIAGRLYCVSSIWPELAIYNLFLVFLGSSSWRISGCIKFLESYYLILVTKRRQIGCVCGHAIYSIEESQLITVPHSSIQTDTAHSKTELRYKKLFSSVDLTKDFFYSYTYPIMRSLQKNVLAIGEEGMPYDNMFVWNAYLTKAIRDQCNSTRWTIALVHGHFKQSHATDWTDDVNQTAGVRAEDDHTSADVKHTAGAWK